MCFWKHFIFFAFNSFCNFMIVSKLGQAFIALPSVCNNSRPSFCWILYKLKNAFWWSVFFYYRLFQLLQQTLCNPNALVPFFWEVTHHIALNHIARGFLVFSNIVPAVSLFWWWHSFVREGIIAYYIPGDSRFYIIYTLKYHIYIVITIEYGKELSAANRLFTEY